MKKSVFETTKWSIKKSKLAILVPCRDLLHSVHALSLIEMMKLNTMHNIDTFVFMDASTVLLTQRLKLALQAQQSGAEYMLWIDSDIAFPATTALRLLGHKEDIVCANYVRRQFPAKGVAYEKMGEWTNPLPFETKAELANIEGIGMGCMLMKTSILDDLPQPWFEFKYTPESLDYLGEDMLFCKKINEAGYQIKVDTQLSFELRHMGTYAFGPDLIKKAN